MSKKLLSFFILIALPFYLKASVASIDVVHLYVPTEDEKPIHQFLFPIMSEYLKFITHEYNKNIIKVGKPQKQNKKVFISAIYRSRVMQRQNLFDYLVFKKGFRYFFDLYDKYNEQFAIQFLEIVLPIYENPERNRTLLARTNLEIDNNLHSPYKIINNVPASQRLIQYFNFIKETSYISSKDSIISIGKNACNVFQINSHFQNTAIHSLKNNIIQKTHVSPQIAEKAAKEVFYMSVAKSLFPLIEPSLKKEGENLFQNLVIGKKLTQWFKTAPAYSQHSISELTDEELQNIKATTDSGKSYNFAVDLGMKTNKGLDQTMIWNYKESYNTLPILKKTILSHPQFSVKHYTLTVIPNKLEMGKEELAVHIAFNIKKNPNFDDEKTFPKKNKKQNEKDSQDIEDTINQQIAKTESEITHPSSNKNNIDNDDQNVSDEKSPNIHQVSTNQSKDESDQNNAGNKKFETPNTDSNNPSKVVPKVNYKDYNNILDKRTSSTKKTFENPKKKKLPE